MPRILLPFLLAILIVPAAPAQTDFPVTTSADSGTGSLRQAILEVDQSSGCPCTITFPASSAGAPLRIDLLSPLPAITKSNVRLGQESLFFPIAELHGPGDGIRLEHVSQVTISGISVIGFSRNGVFVNASSLIQLRAVHLAGNGENGLLIADTSTVSVISSYINANQVNGIYATRSSGLHIAGSFIGTDANNASSGNGANGIHFDNVHGADLQFSSIRNNRYTGVLVTGDSGQYNFEYATFDNNGLLGIDIGADGPTTDGAPVLNSAAFNRGWVRVTGSVHSAPNVPVRLLTYVSEQPDPSGFGEGAAVVLPRSGPNLVITDANGDATFTDYFQEAGSGVALRNRYISVIATGPNGSSEFSRTLLIADAPLDFVVTTTADSGPGSLRDAIDRANQSSDCVAQYPCGISFHLDASASQAGVFRISPTTPLPAITASSVWIDGGTQREFGDDTNPLGPEIEINGSLCNACTGLEMRPGAAASFSLVRELTINGFAGDGVDVVGPVSSLGSPIVRVDGCYLGTDVTGTRPVPNGRGISVSTIDSEIGAVFDNRIAARPAVANVISGNAGDGVVLVGGHAFIEGNFIGTDRTGTAPLANGGSGIRSAGSSHAHDNIIAFNRDRGVVVLQPSLVNSLFPNVIHSNASIGIDIGGDGQTENGTPGIEDSPVILGARTTGDETRVTFHAPLPPANVVLSTAVTFYASSFADTTGRGEGRTWIGGMNIFLDQARDEYEIVVPRNLAGKFITATATVFDAFEFLGAGTTSEFSNASQVTTDDCPTLTPLITSATTTANGTTFEWSPLPGATEYRIWIMPRGDQPQIAYRGIESRTTQSIPTATEWWVEARFDPCYGTQSEHRFVP
ncbi:MAG TPA: right-handed parallel beta-helix repeat-containing protein [Thermoanaerobaculia bacterium]